MADLPEPGHDLGLSSGGRSGSSSATTSCRAGLLEQAGAEIDQQPGPVLRVELDVLAVLKQPDGRVRAQQRAVKRGPYLIEGGHADPVEHGESRAALAR